MSLGPLPPPQGSPLPLPPPVGHAFSEGASRESSDGPEHPGRRGLFIAVVGITVVMTIVGAVVGARVASVGKVPTRVVAPLPSVTPTSPAPASGTALSSSVQPVVAAVGPSVVSVASSSADSDASGFVVRSDGSDGYVVTNEHQLGTGGVRVTFADGSELPATIVGRSPSYDLAVVKVARAGLPVAGLADSSRVVVGDLAVAIGSPLGLDNTVTAGIISAIDRPVTDGSGDAVFSALQTDAAINPGSSGGPVVNAQAQVIGMAATNANLSDQDSGSIGVAFAVPSNQLRRVVAEIIATGHAQLPVLGVALDSSFTGVGSRLRSVDSGGPADAGGLNAGDVVVAIGGHQVHDSLDLVAHLRSAAPGETITVTVAEGSGRRDVAVTLGGREDDGG